MKEYLINKTGYVMRYHDFPGEDIMAWEKPEGQQMIVIRSFCLLQHNRFKPVPVRKTVLPEL